MTGWLAALGIFGGGAFVILFVLMPVMTRIESEVMLRSLKEILEASVLISES